MEKITHGNAVLVNGPTGHKWVSKSKARALCEPPKDPKTGKPVKDKEPFVSPWTYVMGEPPKQAAEPVTVPKPEASATAIEPVKTEDIEEKE